MKGDQYYAAFWFYVRALCAIFDCSITSSYRTAARNKRVGGVWNSFHTEGLAADLVPDDWKKAPAIAEAAKKLGLDVYVEKDHIHVEYDYRN